MYCPQNQRQTKSLWERACPRRRPDGRHSYTEYMPPPLGTPPAFGQRGL